MALLGTQQRMAQDALAEEEARKKKAAKAQASSSKEGGDSKLGGAGGGAAAGATVGMAGGPIGALIGAGIGAAAGAAEANQAEKAAAGGGPGRPSKRRLSYVNELRLETRRRKQRAMAMLSQAVFDWSASVR